MAAFANAQRGQVFGAVYQRNGTGLVRLGEEMVIAPEKFVEAAAEFAGDEGISWVSTDAECVVSEGAWKAREIRGERVECVSSVRAPMIGRMGLAASAAGQFTVADHASEEKRRRIGGELGEERIRRAGKRYDNNQRDGYCEQGIDNLAPIPPVVFKAHDERNQIQTQLQNPEKRADGNVLADEVGGGEQQHGGACG